MDLSKLNKADPYDSKNLTDKSLQQLFRHLNSSISEQSLYSLQDDL